jgi:site-specific recombinase XerD
MPKQLPEYIDDKDVDALEEAIKTKHNFKKTIARDLLLVDVDKDTGLRRTECYKQRHRAFST